MHFIEQLLGLSPDGDTGFTELLILAIPLSAYLALRLLRRKTSKSG